MVQTSDESSRTFDVTFGISINNFLNNEWRIKMPVNDIIAQALDNNPLNLKKAFDDEMTTRVRAALNQKYQDMTQENPEVGEVEAMAADLAAEPAEVEEPAADLPEETEVTEETTESEEN
jgi:hypothetical protein